MNNTILNADEVAARIRLSKRKVYELTRAGRLPHFKYPDSRLYFYRVEEVDKWVATLDDQGRALR